MPATRSSGPPTAASLQPILMEALENFKQKHSKQNQDLIHKNRFLLKTTAELERVIKELKNENLELRIQVQKAHSQTQHWRQKAESSSSHPFSHSPDQTNQIRIALLDIANRCKTLESSLSYPQPTLPSNPSTSVPAFNSTSAASTTDSLPALLPGRNRAELLALRERRRSQFSSDPEEPRLSFINECSGAEDRSESTVLIEPWQSGSTNMQLPTTNSADTMSRVSGASSPGPSNQPAKLLLDRFVVSRPNRRHELMAPVPKKSSNSRAGPEPIPNGHSKTSAQHAQLEVTEEAYDDRSEKQDSHDDAENQSLEDDHTCSGSFSIHNRAMSQLDQSSSSSNSSESDHDSQDDEDSAELNENIHVNARPKDQKALVEDTQWRSRQTQRRSRKQRRTSLTPLHILENVSPAEFSLPTHTLPSPESVEPTTRSRRPDAPDNPKPSGSELSNGTLTSQPTSVKRRDSGLTKEDTDDGPDESQPSQDEGWEKRPVTKKKRVRAELDAVSEEHAASAHPTGLVEQEAAVGSLSGAGLREARRARKEVNYALPSLNKKMRRPDSDGASTVKRKSSIKPPSTHHSSHLNTSTSSSSSTKPPKSSASVKSSGATPSTAGPSNTSCSTTTSLNLDSSPLTSPSSSTNSRRSNTCAPSTLQLKNPPVNSQHKAPLQPSSLDNKDILLNRGRRRTHNL
ncbi:hypothetical protein PtA15_7A370 [Puccinia triticina]|uniref:Shugoshin C-terminal domain-containing protein n=1 Tax=Puccinia triticina TaxID=208348 RepID=A0ABY7CNZ9_9BASI|nr:uncharacterized protein PtA15_7A370 [Puccinia triticina]WAQ86643.1 hypothetical protein PtA15_7A370 [Puccinia triticina]